MSALLDHKKTMERPGESARQIYFTNDYGMFGRIPGNRPLDERRIKKICFANQAHGINLFPYVPILVTRDHKVVEGQHRLMAAKRLQTLIYFIYVDDFDITKIARINSVTKTWGINDYMNCWINLKKDDYLELEKFIEEYHIPISASIKLLMFGDLGGGTGGTHSDTRDAFQSGEFKIYYKESAIALARKFNSYLDICEASRSGALLYAVNMLDKSDKYDHDMVINKLTTTGARLEKKDSPMEFISHIELLYNKGNQKRKVIY